MKLFLYGSFHDSYAGNQRLRWLLDQKFDVERVFKTETAFRPNPLGFARYIGKQALATWIWLRQQPEPIRILIGFTSPYDAMLLRTIGLLAGRRLILVNRIIIGYRDTFTINKPSGKKDGLNWLRSAFYRLCDWGNIALSDLIVFDSIANERRFLRDANFKQSRIASVVIALGANEEVFDRGLKHPQFWDGKFTVIWYGNPSVLHNIGVIVEVMNQLPTERFECILVADMRALLAAEVRPNQDIRHHAVKSSDLPIEKLSDLLQKSHVALGCFGATEKCRKHMINKEYEAVLSNCVLVTAAGEKDFESGKEAILIEECNLQTIVNEILSLEKDRERSRSIAEAGYAAYHAKFGRANASRAISQAIQKIAV